MVAWFVLVLFCRGVLARYHEGLELVTCLELLNQLHLRACLSSRGLLPTQPSPSSPFEVHGIPFNIIIQQSVIYLVISIFICDSFCSLPHKSQHARALFRIGWYHHTIVFSFSFTVNDVTLEFYIQGAPLSVWSHESNGKVRIGS